MVNNLYNNLVSLHSFSLFSEYFIAFSTIYLLILVLLISYNSYGLMIQKTVSECIALILLMSCYLLINDDLLAGSQFFSFSGSIINDYFAFFTKFLICFFSALYFLFIADSLKEQKLTSFEYLIIILFSILGLLLMCSSNDLLIAYLSIELSSLAFYVLASFRKTSNYSVESGIKYFITGSVSSAFFLLGSSFLYATSGSINFSSFLCMFGGEHYVVVPYRTIPAIVEDPMLFFFYWLAEYNNYYLTEPLFDYNFIELALTLILFSLFIKLALAPFHLWSLDVYEGSPTSSTIFFAVISKLSVFVLLIRFCYVCFNNIKDYWEFYFFWVGTLSVFVGAFGGLKQRKLKTLLAYSSISHMGYVLVALSTTAYFGIQMLVFYMIIYMVSGLCTWSIFLFLRLKKNSTLKYNKELGDFALLRKANPAIALALSLTMFSMAGIPPMIGFLAKLNVFLSLVQFSSYFIGLIVILFSVISTFYYIRIVKILYFENLLIGKLYYPISSEKTVVFSFLIFSLIFLFINPTLLYLFCYKVILASEFDLIFQPNLISKLEVMLST